MAHKSDLTFDDFKRIETLLLEYPPEGDEHSAANELAKKCYQAMVNIANSKAGRTHLSYLDIEAFYQRASLAMLWQPTKYVDGGPAKQALDMQAEMVLALIEAIRNDGLDPKYHPERGMLTGIHVVGSALNGNVECEIELDDDAAQNIVDALRQRGYQITKAQP